MADDPKRYSNTRLLSQPDKKGEGGVAASVRNVWKEEKGGEVREMKGNAKIKQNERKYSVICSIMTNEKISTSRPFKTRQ